MRSCVLQVIIQRHGSMVTSTDLGLVFPCLYELFGGGVEMVRMQPGVGTVEQAGVRDQPELHFTIMESLCKVVCQRTHRNCQANDQNDIMLS